MADLARKFPVGTRVKYIGTRGVAHHRGKTATVVWYQDANGLVLEFEGKSTGSAVPTMVELVALPKMSAEQASALRESLAALLARLSGQPMSAEELRSTHDIGHAGMQGVFDLKRIVDLARKLPVGSRVKYVGTRGVPHHRGKTATVVWYRDANRLELQFEDGRLGEAAPDNVELVALPKMSPEQVTTLRESLASVLARLTGQAADA
jgi:hypothetical protein